MSSVREILWKLEPYLLQIHQKPFQPLPPNLEGDRYIEYSWITANIPNGIDRA